MSDRRGKGLNSIPVRFAMMSAVLTAAAIGGQSMVLHAGAGSLTQVMTAATAVVISTTIIFLAASRLSGFIRALRDSIAAIANGHLDAPIDVDCACEVGGLADSFRAMVKRLNRNIAHMNALAYTDPVTALPNRTVVAQILDLMQRGVGAGGSGGALLFLDLDGFKRVNDRLGHDAGDDLLRQVSERLMRRGLQLDPGDMDHCTNAYGELTDKYPEKPVLARFAGDEFVIILPGIGGKQEIAAYTDRILAAIAEPFVITGGQVRVNVSVSIGIARMPLDTFKADELLTFADLAMYEAKQTGKNRAVCFGATLTHAMVERAQLETDLQRAIERDEISLCYQPKFDMRTKTLSGVEALACWTHPTLGQIAPEVFVPIAEQHGLMIPLGFCILRQAAAQCRRWLDDGIKRRVAINISPLQFESEIAVRDLSCIIDHYRIDPSLLVFEISERALITDAGRSKIERMRELGVSLSIDDFGSSYSSLAELSRLPFDELKIDPLLIHGLGASERKHALVEAMIGMARVLDFRVVAEGVETMQQLNYLQQLGCDEVQGYLFARPMAAGDLDRWLTLREAGRVVDLQAWPARFIS